MADQPLLAVVTGELFQPVRLHYKILNHGGLRRAFEKLRCLDYDPAGKRWVWLYAHEAKKLQFKKSYAQIPKELHPIVIGAFFVRTKETLLLDVRSCERALAAIPFFDEHLPKKVVELGDAELANQLFPATEANQKLTAGALFDRQISYGPDSETMIKQLTDKLAGEGNLEAKLAMALDDLHARARKPLPEIERIPIHYAEDGIAGFEMALRLRQMVAMQHWLGKPEYTLDDALNTMIRVPRISSPPSGKSSSSDEEVGS